MSDVRALIPPHDELVAILEALIFASEKPLTVQEMVQVIAEIVHARERGLPVEEDEAEEEAPEQAVQNVPLGGELASAEPMGGTPVEPPVDARDEEPVAAFEHIEQPLEAPAAEHPDITEPTPEAPAEEPLLTLTQEMQITTIRQEVYHALDELQRAWADPTRRHGRGFRLQEVAGGFTFRTDPLYAEFLWAAQHLKPKRLSRANLESLAVIAYQQPITKPQIDAIRGVDSSASIKSLLDRNLIRVLGRKEEPGRPLLYGTTQEFLSYFNLKGLSDLPTLRDLEDLSAVEQVQGEVDAISQQQSIHDLLGPITLSAEQGEDLMEGIDSALDRLSRSKRQIAKVMEEDQQGQQLPGIPGELPLEGGADAAPAAQPTAPSEAAAPSEKEPKPAPVETVPEAVPVEAAAPGDDKDTVKES